MDKLSGRSSQLGLRNPPSFIRTPSRRYQRRIVEGASEGISIIVAMFFIHTINLLIY